MNLFIRLGILLLLAIAPAQNLRAGCANNDIIAPNTPLMDSVSVDASGNAVVGWQQSSSSDVEGYVIYQYINGIWTAIDTVWGQTNTTYTNPISNADQQTEMYMVAAIDSCRNVSVAATPHLSIYFTQSIDLCRASVDLIWNNYINFTAGLAGYNIYSSLNNGPWTLVGSTIGNDSTFTHTGLIAMNNYCYFIEAVDVSGLVTSRSQVMCLLANIPLAPTFEYIRTATVSSPNQVTIAAFVDAPADIIRYDFYRADSLTGNWSLLGSIPTAAPAASQLTFIDASAKTSVKSYFYKFIAINTCGLESFTSNIAQTILLTGVSTENFTNEIEWNDYALWLGGVMDYTVLRSVDEGPFLPIATIPFTGVGANSFVDDVSNFTSDIGRFRYIIRANEGATNPYLIADSSFSNEILVLQQPLVFVPNAFTPNINGLNDTWRPITGFVDIVDYDLNVYNRWGQQIFHTNDREEGWNGRNGDTRLEGEVYVWTLTFKTASGQFVDKKGTVTIYR
jgi:gliding motility-associated-like protein